MNENKNKRVIIHVFGVVQGVFFRATTRKVANKLSINGYVKNLPDGSVKIVAEGKEEKLLKLIEFAKEGPPAANVYNIKTEWSEKKGELPSFRIAY